MKLAKLHDIATAAQLFEESDSQDSANVVCYASLENGVYRSCHLVDDIRNGSTVAIEISRRDSGPPKENTSLRATHMNQGPVRKTRTEVTQRAGVCNHARVRTEVYGKTSEGDDVEHFFGFRKIFQDGQQQDFQLGSRCFLLPSDPKEEMYIAQIESIFRKRTSKEVLVKCHWFKRINDSSYELTLTNTFDLNTTDSIEGPCEVVKEQNDRKYFCKSATIFDWFL